MTQTSNTTAEAEIISDFAELARYGDESCQLVCFVLAVHSVVMTGDRRYLLKATLGDKNGRRLYLVWFFDVQRASKALGVQSRVAKKPMWEIAVATLHSALLRAVCINPIKIKRTNARYKNPGNIVAVFTHLSQIHPLDPIADIPRIRPSLGSWGTPDSPFETIATDLHSLEFGKKYFFIAFIVSVNKGTKQWTHKWESGDVKNTMACGQVMLYTGEDETGTITFESVSWIAFLQLEPKPRAPW